MDEIQKALIETFKSETSELLTELESALLELEESPEDRELVDRIFRALHTIKGNGSMFGFDRISRFTHDIESTFELVRDGVIVIDKVIIDLTLAARDVISRMMEDGDKEDPVLDNTAEGLLSAFRKILPVVSEDPKPERKTSPDELSVNSTYRIRFRPHEDILFSGSNPLLLLKELAGLGPVTVLPNLKNLPDLKKMDPEMCYLSWDILLTTTRSINSIRDVFLFVEDLCELNIDFIDEEGSLETAGEHMRLGDILIERGDLTRQDLESVLDRKRPLGEELVARRLVDDDAVEAALQEQQVVREMRSKRVRDEAVSSVRVASEKLDSLVNLVGELVTVQARLSRTALLLADPDLMTISEHLEMLTWNLRDDAFSIRMIPIGASFSSLRRTVRDLASETGREVVLVTEGGETELDKTIIERLRDPLVHLIRNAIDHGIEPPDEREKEGKPRGGVITISASQTGADVMICVSDDGKGMDLTAIKDKAVRMGLIHSESKPDPKELCALVFEPAFSTAEKVTSISGRGVGLDVVRKQVDALRGLIEVDSLKGRGTDIIIKLPLTLAIIEGLQVDIAGEKYIFPLSLVEECVELKKEDADSVKGRKIANVRGELIPYINLREWFHTGDEGSEIQQIVITNRGGMRVGFVVDYVVGEHQTVIKSLGKIYRKVDGISGATVLGDGTVALILDLPAIIKKLEASSHEEPRAAQAR
jgi:two-component system chemotaxis sensor kinase CheA